MPVVFDPKFFSAKVGGSRFLAMPSIDGRTKNDQMPPAILLVTFLGWLTPSKVK